VIDAGTCTLIAALGALLSPAIGWVAGILAALSVTLVVFSSQILTDTLFLFFFTLTLLAGAHFLRRPSRWLALLAGFAGGLALATRPTIAVLLAAAVPLVLVVVLAHRRGLVAALAATALFTLGAAAPIVPTWLRNVVQYGSLGLTTQAGEHLASFIVPLVTQRANGTPYQTTVDRMGALYRQRVAELGTETNPFRLAALKSEVAREEMAHLPLGAYVKAWLEGMVVNLAAPALTGDPRMRALPKPSFYNTPGASLWEKARAYLLDDPGWYQVLLVAGIIGMLPFLVLEAVGFVMLARMQPWAAVLGAGILAYFLLLSGPVATPKYRLPMEPVLIVLAAIPLARVVERRIAQLRSSCRARSSRGITPRNRAQALPATDPG
jgi:4-amino-4-deoxy-L-arabinose transferase-like glycosyltransferase